MLLSQFISITKVANQTSPQRQPIRVTIRPQREDKPLAMLNHLGLSPCSSPLIKSISMIDANHNDLPADKLNTPLLRILEENRKLQQDVEQEKEVVQRLQYKWECERQQRILEHDLMDSILQSITESEIELECGGRDVYALSRVVSKLITFSCSRELATHSKLKNLAKRIVISYSNQLKHIERLDKEAKLREMSTNNEPQDPLKSPQRPLNSAIGLEVVCEASDEEEFYDDESCSDESDRESATLPSLSTSEFDSWLNAGQTCVETDESEISNLLDSLIDTVVAESLGDSGEGSIVQSETSEPQTVAEKSKIRSDVGVQAEGDNEKAELLEQIRDLKDAVHQQSLQLLLSNEEILSMKSKPTKKTEDDLLAFKELVHQQSALLEKLKQELEEANQKLAAREEKTSVSVQVPEKVKFTYLERDLFDEISIDNSDLSDSICSENYLRVSPASHTSELFSAIHRQEVASYPKVRNLSSRLKMLFQKTSASSPTR